MKVKSTPLFEAFDICREILQSEGSKVSIRKLRSLMEDRFPDVIQEHQGMIQQAGLNAILRRVCKQHSGEVSYSATQIALAFEVPNKLPASIPLPVDRKSMEISEWKELCDCTFSEVALTLSYLANCIRNDGKKRRALEELRQRAAGVLGKRFRESMTVAEAIRIIEVSA